MAGQFSRWLSAIAGGSAPIEDRAPAEPAAKRIRRGGRAEYDGATMGRRSAGWQRSRLDPNGELSPAVLAALRGVSRELVRNNPHASAGVARIAEAMVGPGITFQVYRNGAVDDRLNAIARDHLDTSSCDAAGRHDLYGLQLQAARTIVESGAAIMRRRWRRMSDGLPLPFQLQVIEPDYIDAGRHGQLRAEPGKTPGFIINGIQFSPLGKREGYWLYSGHPGAARPTSLSSNFISAADVAHVFRADRPEQEHGAPWLTPVILRMKDFGDYEDAQLQRQKLAAAFAGFRYGDPDASNIVGHDEETVGEPLDYVEPGTISDLREGERIEWSNPPGVDGYVDYARVSLRAISVGLGVPYEELTGDLSQVSFISGRLGRLRYRRSVATWQWLMFVPQFCGSVGQWLIDAMDALGEDTTGVTIQWTPPAVEMLDPATEIPALRDGIRSGVLNLSEALQERGVDPDRHLAQRKADNDLLDRLGITLDSDPRKVTAVGNPATADSAAARAQRDKKGP
jgi:lambda family phage portal protein